MSRRPTYAQTTMKSAALSSDFGLSYAIHQFGQDAVDSLPKLQSGPNKGHPKGHIMWLRTTSAGYHPNMGTGVGPGVTVRAWIAEKQMAHETSASVGKWMGRMQSLCGSASVLGPEARLKNEREAAAREAAWQEEKAEMLAERKAAQQ